MKKKLLAILMATAMSMTVIACGGSGEEAAAPAQEKTAEDVTVDEVEEVSADYTKEQAALLDEFQQMVDNYNVAVDAANQVSQITEDEELVNIMNELTAEIDSMTELLADPANMTEEFMTGLRGAMEQTYATINRLNSLSELLPILTIAGVGVDEEENTYLFAFNEEETVGAMVILSADQTQNVYCAGDMVVSEDGTYTISNGEYEMSMLVEVMEEGLAITMQDGTVVGMVGAEPKAVVDAMLSIEEATENVNGQ